MRDGEISTIANKDCPFTDWRGKHENMQTSSLENNNINRGSPAPTPQRENKHASGDVQQVRKGAWIQVIGGFLAFLNIWGFPLSYGVFQAFYALYYLPQRSTSELAWIGTVQNALVSIISVLSGPLYDLGYYHTLVFLGTFCSVAGIFTLSLSTEYYQIFLSHACNGIGSGLLYVPTLSLITQSHDETRSLAISVVASGIALGGVVYTVVFLQLQPVAGFAWTVRTCGFIALVSYLVAVPCLLGGARQMQVSGKARKLLTLDALRNKVWWLFSLAQFMSFWGYLIPAFFLPTFAKVVVGASQTSGDLLLVGFQGASLFGRLGAGFAAHKLGVMMPLTLCLVISGILNLTWLAVKSIGGLAVYAALYGLFSGALTALPPSIFPAVCTDSRSSGTWMGMAWSMTAVASLTGSIIGGAFVNIQEADFVGAQIWSGAMLFVGAVLFGILWFELYRTGRKLLI